MVFLERVQPNFHAVVIIGEGLVGSSLRDYLLGALNFNKAANFKIPWGQESFQSKLQEIKSHLRVQYFKYGKDLIQSGTEKKGKDIRSNFINGSDGVDDGSEDSTIYETTFDHIQISFVWCAGRAGFSASVNDIEKEEKDFLLFLEMLSQFYDELPEFVKIDLHFMSSAGGLFEGQSAVSEHSIPRPLRPYGQLKWKQELKIKEFMSLRPDCACTIYRPSSIYGRITQGQRIGLITNMLQNGIMKKVTPITGDLFTLRDYIHSIDVAKIISTGLLNLQMKNRHEENRCRVVFCLSQKPTTIYEIKSIIEFYLKHKIYIQLYFQPGNSRDITFSKMESPFGVQGRDIRSGIKDILIHWYGVNI